MTGIWEQLPDGIRAIDTMTAGVTKVTAGYLLDAARPTLIECGPALSVRHVIDGLADLGMDPGDLAYLVLSHIHLDHAGGAGNVARAFPSATIVVSEIGARHLVDPTRLNSSSRRVYGDLMDSRRPPAAAAPHSRSRQASHRRVRRRLGRVVRG
jgi:glyoxylase-like metal-dependent hydrolase (beta-lactamase superfamily II)